MNELHGYNRLIRLAEQFENKAREAGYEIAKVDVSVFVSKNVALQSDELHVKITIVLATIKGSTFNAVKYFKSIAEAEDDLEKCLKILNQPSNKDVDYE